jgi:plasmid replication initiation protein
MFENILKCEKSEYLRYLFICKQLSCKYSFPFYLLLKNTRSTQSPWINTTFLACKLGIGKKTYSKFKTFKFRILKKIASEINAKTDLNVAVTFKKSTQNSIDIKISQKAKKSFFEATRFKLFSHKIKLKINEHKTNQLSNKAFKNYDFFLKLISTKLIIAIIAP